MNLLSRINQLEARNSIQCPRPAVTCIFFRGVYAVDQVTGEVTDAMTAYSMVWSPKGWRTISRKDGEPDATFIKRIKEIDTMVD